MENNVDLQMIKELRKKMDEKNAEYMSVQKRIYDEKSGVSSELLSKIENLYTGKYIQIDNCFMLLKRIVYVHSDDSFYFRGPGVYVNSGTYEFSESYTVKGLYIEDFDTSSGTSEKIKIVDKLEFNTFIDKFIDALNNQIKEASDEN